jgi:hypothetical protein
MISRLTAFFAFAAFAFVMAILGAAALQGGLFVAAPFILLSGLMAAWSLIVLLDFE